MSAGTIRLTNGSTAVVGAGTAFTTELAAADFVVATVGGTTYTLAVDTVTNATNLVLSAAFTGPTTASVSWQAVPRKSMLRVTAELNNQVTASLRAQSDNALNWQQVLSQPSTATVILPDGSTVTGPSWKYLSANAAIKSGGAVPVNQGGTGSLNANDASGNLTFHTVYQPEPIAGNVDMNDLIGVSSSAGMTYRIMDGSTFTNFPTGKYGGKAYMWGALVTDKITIGSSPQCIQTYYSDNAADMSFRVNYSGTWKEWVAVLTNNNTTVDSNGFIKRASPIVQVYGDGASQTNAESDGATVTREDIGVYRISGILGMNSDRSWGGNGGGVEVPKDINGQPRVWVDYDIDSDGSIILRTYHRTHPDAPVFARNLIGTKDDAGRFTETVMNGEPIDIPDDVFISVRVEMPQDSIYQKALSEQRDMMDSMDS